MNDTLQSFQRLLDIMNDLREKCPWDKKQTMESLRHLTIEEVYELADSILEKDMKGIRGELGDLLLHIVFYAKIGSETNDFNMKDVLDGICEKLIQRHPHIYGDVKVENEEDVKRNWEKLKLKEGKKSVLEGVPVSLPALVKASRIQDKAKGVGFDWDNRSQVWEKVREEMEELREEVEKNPGAEAVEAEFGDVMFSLINYARFIGVNPEDALEKTNRKFIRRFQAMEDMARDQGQAFDQMSLEEMDVLWNEAKKA
ncbi:MAG: nucleoside triphosphate pyrophosphohydrolase [Flavobacteriales bacterium]|nr:nucleoside triphosphate pyrophosphohydrolase [Flavobacteriales bacterium]MCB9447366.1 nucleoside triphosphate pyrophosphohydrolase [Flavobacteriales bacterium]